MGFIFYPDYRFSKFDDVSAEFLLSIGVKAVLLDIDNTLEPYENPMPSERVINWLASLSSNGIKAGIVSNNEEERVALFNKELGLTAYSKAGKPFKKKLLLTMETLGVSPSETIFMGDQVFTDVWAAHNAKIRAILVPPIKDKKNFITKFKRMLEKPILKSFEKRRKRLENKNNDKT